MVTRLTQPSVFDTSSLLTGFTEGSVIFIDSVPSLQEDNTNFFWDDTNNRLGIGNNTPSVPLDVTGASLLGGSVTIGIGAAGVDYSLTFDGETNDGLIIWREDEDYFQFSDDIQLPDNELLKLGTGIDATIGYDGTDLVINPDAVGTGKAKFTGDFQLTDGTNTIDYDESEHTFTYNLKSGAENHFKITGTEAAKSAAAPKFFNMDITRTWSDAAYIGVASFNAVTISDQRNITSGFDLSSVYKFSYTYESPYDNNGGIGTVIGLDFNMSAQSTANADGGFQIYGMKIDGVNDFTTDANAQRRNEFYNYAGYGNALGENSNVGGSASTLSKTKGFYFAPGQDNTGSIATEEQQDTVDVVAFEDKGALSSIFFTSGSGKTVDWTSVKINPVLAWGALADAPTITLYGINFNPSLSPFLEETSTWYGIYYARTGSGADTNYFIWQTDDDYVIDNDGSKIIFGEGQDAEISYDGTDLVVNPKAVGSGGLLMDTDSKILFRDSAIFIHSNSDGNMTIEADTKVTIGVAGDIELGDSTERDMFPNTTLKVNLGKSANKFNDAYIGGDTQMDGDLTFTTSGGGLAYADMSANDVDLEHTISGTGQANKVQVTAFDANGESNNMTPDHTNDHITVDKAGRYLCDLSMTMESVAGSAAEFGYAIYKNNGATEFTNLHGHRDLAGGGGAAGSISLSGIISLAVSDTIEVWVWNETNTQNFKIDDINLALVQIGG